MEECWMPELVPCDDLSHWDEYDALLYGLFKEEWMERKPVFEGKEIRIRSNPRYEGREEAYWHLTCRDYGKEGKGSAGRDPDLERCARIKWPRAFIENYLLCKACGIAGCEGVLVWRARSAKGRERVKIFSREERYIVVLEPRNNYCLLITAYFISEDYSLRACLREYERNRS